MNAFVLDSSFVMKAGAVVCHGACNNLMMFSPPHTHTHTQLLYWPEVPPEAELVVFSFVLDLLHCERWTDGE